MHTLIINAHPDFKNNNTFSAKLKELFMEKFTTAFPNEAPEVLNLYDMELPRIEETQLLKIWGKQSANQPLTEEEQIIADTSANLLTQFKRCQRIVIVSPLHNFNITSRMKDYMDNIMLARETFKYTEDGSVGLMTDNYKALLLQASGTVYTNNDRYTPLEFSYYYLKEMFEEIMGFDAFYIARAEGTSIMSEDDVINKAKTNLDEVFNKFYEA
jgi:FMN-dependent NADH-azoreductase